MNLSGRDVCPVESAQAQANVDISRKPDATVQDTHVGQKICMPFAKKSPAHPNSCAVSETNEELEKEANSRVSRMRDAKSARSPGDMKPPPSTHSHAASANVARKRRSPSSYYLESNLSSSEDGSLYLPNRVPKMKGMASAKKRNEKKEYRPSGLHCMNWNWILHCRRTTRSICLHAIQSQQSSHPFLQRKRTMKRGFNMM